MASEQPHEESIFNTARSLNSRKAQTQYLAEACGDDTALRERIEKLLAAFDAESQFLEQPAPGLEPTIVSEALSQDRASSLDAGLTAAFSLDHAVVIGDQHHSVLKMLGRTLDSVPRVALRDESGPGADPIVQPHSPEIPKSNSDSRYQLQGEIARGGMGAILKGRDIDLGRDLAIKVLLDAHKDNPQVIQRFIEEAQIGGQLQHPGIAPVYELGQFADQRPFFSMKLVKGETLSKLLADRKNSEDERGKFIGIFEQICQTMAYAHSRGVIHRDLKPANIMVGAFGEVQVMDWGLAKVLQKGGVADEKNAKQKQQGQSIIQTMRSMGSDAPESFGSHGSGGSETQMGSVMGTPAYIPPEQALGEIDQMDQRADVFGLGAILAEILTGKPPYVGADGTQVYRLASRGKLDDCFARLDACGADHDLISLTKHCLELEPADRPKDAGVLAQRVTEYQDSVETKLRETELERAAEAARVVEQKKRLRVTIALAAAVVMMLIGGGSFAWWQNQQNQIFVQREARNAEAVASLIDQCVESLQSGDTDKAAVALIAAQQRSEEGGAEQYQSQLKLLATDLALVQALDAVDQFKWTWTNNKFAENDEVTKRFRAALLGFGVDFDKDSSTTICTRLEKSQIKSRIVAAMNHMFFHGRDRTALDALQQADPDRYRNAIRNAFARGEVTEALELVASEKALEQPCDFTAILTDIKDVTEERRLSLSESAIVRNPSNIDLLMKLTTLSDIEPAEMLRWAQAAVSAAPGNAAAHINLGFALSDSDSDAAIACYKKAIAIDPFNAVAYNNLSGELSSKGLLNEASIHAKKAIELDPNNASAHSNLGRILVEQRDFEAALLESRTAIELDPTDARWHADLGFLFFSNGDWDQSIACMRTAIELDPSSAENYVRLAVALMEKSDLEGSIDAYRTAIELEPTNAEYHERLGYSLYTKKDFKGAITCYRNAIAIDSKLASSEVAHA